MGISIHVNAKQDYSYLFRNFSAGSSSNGLGNLNFFSDYAAIKNGSYGKLMKAYYAKDDSDGTPTAAISKIDSRTTSTAADSTRTLAAIEKSADKLKESADALISKGADSVFKQKEIVTKDENGVETAKKGYDTDAIYSAVSDFVKDYNSLLENAGNANATNISNKTLSLVNMTKANEKLLSDVGITIDKDNALSIHEETFKKADVSTVKTLFNGSGSYAYRVSAQASLIDFAANTESSRANTYTFNGTYGNTYSTGNIFNSLF